MGIDSNKYFAECISDDLFGCEEPIGSITKRRRCELDNFLTITEVCRHFFDTLTIEEAIWDLVGIPRLIVFNGNEDKMKKAGWKYCKVKSVLGDKTVQLGSRVAYVYSGSWCTIWKEQELDADMDSDRLRTQRTSCLDYYLSEHNRRLASSTQKIQTRLLYSRMEREYC